MDQSLAGGKRQRAGLAQVAPESSLGTALVPLSGSPAPPGTTTRVSAMKAFVADESLSEETRSSAQQALDELVSAQIEQEKLEFSEEMSEWLRRHRLLHYIGIVTSVAGR